MTREPSLAPSCRSRPVRRRSGSSARTNGAHGAATRRRVDGPDNLITLAEWCGESAGTSSGWAAGRLQQKLGRTAGLTVRNLHQVVLFKPTDSRHRPGPPFDASGAVAAALQELLDR